MSYIGREGSPLAQRPVNKKQSATYGAKSAPRTERSLSASPLPQVELSGAVTELVLENEKLIGETIVLRGSYKALAEKCGVYQTENERLKEELNMLRNELGLAHDAVTNKDGTVVNYKKECERLNLVVERQSEETEKLKAMVEGATARIHATASVTSASASLDEVGERMLEEINSATRQATNLIKLVKLLDDNVAASKARGRTDAAQWDKDLQNLDKQLARIRENRDNTSSSTSVVAVAALPVRTLCVDSVDLAISLIRKSIASP